MDQWDANNASLDLDFATPGNPDGTNAPPETATVGESPKFNSEQTESTTGVEGDAAKTDPALGKQGKPQATVGHGPTGMNPDALENV